jgi:SAM-dependent methyltransferase
MNTNDILTKLKTDIFFDLTSWKKSLCPYSLNELSDFSYKRTDSISEGWKKNHIEFVKLYESLSIDEKNHIKNWLLDNLAIPTWNKGFGIRPKWTWENFLSKLNNKSLKYLDIAPCHGIHSNILYKEYFKGSFEYFSVEILPAYLELQTFFGINSSYFDAERMNLSEIYDESSMDVIIFSEVLEHLSLSDGTKLLEEISKILSKNGSLFLSFPVDASPFNAEPFGHIHQPDIDEVSSLLHKFGVKNQQYVKLWSGKTYQHVLMASK